MKYKNSFFKIRIKEDGTYLDVFPPKEDGKRLDIREVVSFLEQKGFAGFSIDALRKTLDLLQEKPLQIKISVHIIFNHITHSLLNVLSFANLFIFT